MNLRVLLAVLLAAFLCFSHAHAAQQGGSLQSPRAVFSDLLELVYRPLEHRDLLTAAWTALQSDAAVHGLTPPQNLEDLPDDPAQAFGVFASAYSQYVASQSPQNA